MILELGQLPEIIWPPAPSPNKEAAGDKLGDLSKALWQVTGPAKSRWQPPRLSHGLPAAPEPWLPRSRAEDSPSSKKENK